MNSIIKLEKVFTVYEGERRPAIKNITLTFKRKELVYIIGPNASGKTTLLETINGLLPPIKGEISVFGLNVEVHGRKVRCDIGYVPQDFMVKPGEPYTAIDVVMMGRYGKIGVLRKPNEEDKERVMKAMNLLDIEGLAYRPMGKLSGGQQQKVMIARALAKEPKVLLLDEPFSNLDPDSKRRIPYLIREIHKEKELTTLIVTHELYNLPKTCRRIIGMVDGKILVDEIPEKALPIMENRLNNPTLEVI